MSTGSTLSTLLANLENLATTNDAIDAGLVREAINALTTLSNKNTEIYRLRGELDLMRQRLAHANNRAQRMETTITELRAVTTQHDEWLGIPIELRREPPEASEIERLRNEVKFLRSVRPIAREYTAQKNLLDALRTLAETRGGPVKTVSGQDVYALLLPPVPRDAGVNAAFDALLKEQP